MFHMFLISGNSNGIHSNLDMFSLGFFVVSALEDFNKIRIWLTHFCYGIKWDVCGECWDVTFSILSMQSSWQRVLFWGMQRWFVLKWHEENFNLNRIRLDMKERMLCNRGWISDRIFLREIAYQICTGGYERKSLGVVAFKYLVRGKNVSLNWNAFILRSRNKILGQRRIYETWDKETKVLMFVP